MEEVKDRDDKSLGTFDQLMNSLEETFGDTNKQTRAQQKLWQYRQNGNRQKPFSWSLTSSEDQLDTTRRTITSSSNY